MKQPKPGESREQRRQGAGSVRGGVTAPHQPMARLGVRDRSGVRPLPINERRQCVAAHSINLWRLGASRPPRRQTLQLH
jgi:hypothetical protein